MRLVFTVASRLDLADVGDVIAGSNPVRAISYIAEVEHDVGSWLMRRTFTRSSRITKNPASDASFMAPI